MSQTEKEILLEFDKNFFIGSLQWKKSKIDHEDLKTFMPEGSVFSIVDKDSLQLLYICQDGEKRLDTSLEEILNKGAAFSREITHPESIKRIFPQWKYYYNFGDHNRPFVRFQKLRSNPNMDYFLTRTSKLVNRERKSFLNMHNFVNQIKQPNSRKLYIDKEIEFAHQNYHKFYRLTAYEKRLLALLGNGLRPTDIADQLNTGYENVRKNIKRINVKLELIKSSFNKASIYTKYAIYFQLI